MSTGRHINQLRAVWESSQAVGQDSFQASPIGWPLLPPPRAEHTEASAVGAQTWSPRRGRPKNTYVDTLKRDTGGDSVEELATLMMDRDEWKSHVKARLRPP